MSAPTLNSLLCCPSCRSALGEGHACAGCGTRYPVLDGIPWLLPQPATTLAEWQLRLKHVLQRMDGEAEELKAELKATGLGELTTKRLRKLLQAKVEHRKAVAELLEPLTLTQLGTEEMSRAMNVRVPATQSLTGYYVNVHRDWAWETTENQACWDAVAAACQDLDARGKSLLVLGAGAGRLAYDLHQQWQPALTVATDINPLMLLAAKKIFKGRNLKLHEFPLAPKDLESHAILRKCAAPEAARPGLELAFADALTPPFAAQSFDFVVTPWLIDILPPSLPALAATINRLLKPQGRWVNFGSLGFNHARATDNLSLEEVLEVVQGAGFAPGEPSRRQIPYMQSPASAHGRVELVTTFAARKQEEAKAVAGKGFSYLPEWLAASDAPVPRLKSFDAFMTINSILLDTVSMIDGKRTLKDLAQVFAQKHGLPIAEAETSIKGFLVRHFEANQLGRQH